MTLIRITDTTIPISIVVVTSDLERIALYSNWKTFLCYVKSVLQKKMNMATLRTEKLCTANLTQLEYLLLETISPITFRNED